MLDTKLKNRHKLAVILIIFTIVIAATSVTEQYFTWYLQSDDSKMEIYHDTVTSQEFLGKFVEATYILYNQENSRGSEVDWALEEQFSYEKQGFDGFYPYLDYTVEDGNGDIVADSGVTMTEHNMKLYTTAMIISYYENGVPYVQMKQGEYEDEQRIQLREITGGDTALQKDCTVEVFDEEDNLVEVTLKAPKNRTYYLAVSEENQALYLDDQLGFNETLVTVNMSWWILGVMALVAIAAWVYPVVPSFRTGNEKIFKVPLEIAVLVFLFSL